MKRKSDHPDELVYRVRWAPGEIDGRNYAHAVARGELELESQVFELKLTDDKYRAWTDLDDEVPVVTVPCHLLSYGPEISAIDGAGLHVWMRFRALPDTDHGLDLRDPFWILAEDYQDYEPTNGFVHPSVPQFGL